MPSFELSEALEHGGAANSDKSGVSAKAYSSAKIESKSSAASRKIALHLLTALVRE